MWGKVPADGRLRKRREGSKNKEEGREDLHRRLDVGGGGCEPVRKTGNICKIITGMLQDVWNQKHFTFFGGAASVAVYKRMCEGAICHLAGAGPQRKRE